MGWGIASQEGTRDNKKRETVLERKVWPPVLGNSSAHHCGFGAKREKEGTCGKPVAQKSSIKLPPWDETGKGSPSVLGLLGRR